MNNIQKKTYIDKDETDSMEKNKQMKIKIGKKTNCVHIAHMCIFYDRSISLINNSHGHFFTS